MCTHTFLSTINRNKRPKLSFYCVTRGKSRDGLGCATVRPSSSNVN